MGFRFLSGSAYLKDWTLPSEVFASRPHTVVATGLGLSTTEQSSGILGSRSTHSGGVSFRWNQYADTLKYGYTRYGYIDGLASNGPRFGDVLMPSRVVYRVAASDYWVDCNTGPAYRDVSTGYNVGGVDPNLDGFVFCGVERTSSTTVGPVGTMAEVAIYDGLLSDAEVQRYLHGWVPSEIRPGALLRYYPLREDIYDRVTGAKLVVTGYTTADQFRAHPEVKRKRRSVFLPVAAAGGSNLAWALAGSRASLAGARGLAG